MASSVKVVGREALKRKFEALPQAAQIAIRAAMEKQAQAIVEMAQRLVPVVTGTLRDSIGWTWGEAPKGSMSLAVVKATGGNEMTLTVYAGSRVGKGGAFYARWVEFGTINQPAQPYFYVSYRANRKKAKSAIRRAVTKSAKAVAAGGR
jgi:HK97 gp10 family phage protein